MAEKEIAEITKEKQVLWDTTIPEFRTIKLVRDEEYPFVFNLILNRPDKNNAISIGPTEMTGELKEAFRLVNQIDECKVVVVQGAGKNFCAGFDLSFVYRVYGGDKNAKPSQRIRLLVDQYELYGFPQAILDCDKVVISKVHGWAIEAGLYITKASDIIVAAENAKFSQMGQRLAFGGLPTLPLELLMGHTKKVIEILLTGRTISGKEAEEVGYCTKAVPAEDLDNEVHHLAGAISVLPRDVVVMGKVARRHMLDRMGLTTLKEVITYHTLSVNLKYTDDERELMFIRDRESMGEREAFHKMHAKYDAALEKTKFFRNYDPRKTG
jgi:enoyl-CoA hydratase